jgi:transcriptional regulator with XRE-family HTH domain
MKIETSTVKRLCKENGTNLKKIAYKLGIPYNTIYAATKRGSCSKEVAEAIASLFDVDVSYICGEPANKKLCDTLLMYRKEKGFTQERLAAEINTTKATISRYENGERTPDIYIFARLCAVLGISMDDVLNEKDEIDLNNLLNPDDRTRLFRILAEIFDWNFQPGILRSTEIKLLAELLIANGVTFKEEKECPKN